MNKYYYDLHIHSCLSPCGDNDMTPNNIAGMAALKGLNLLALTDHNTAKNCPAFFEACRRQGIVPIAGMELTTAEDIHIVCLFETLEAALAFDAFVDGKRVKIKTAPTFSASRSSATATTSRSGRRRICFPTPPSCRWRRPWKARVRTVPSSIRRMSTGRPTES